MIAALPADLLLQDMDRKLSQALASKPDAPLHAREAAAAIKTPEAVAKPMTDDDCADMVTKALRRAWSLGQTYCQQADSDSFVQNKRADKTAAMFAELVNSTHTALVEHLKAA